MWYLIILKFLIIAFLFTFDNIEFGIVRPGPGSSKHRLLNELVKC